MTKFLCTTNTPSRVVPYMAFSNKSKMAAAAIFNFGKMSITPNWIKTSVPYFMGRCILAMRRWPHDQKSKPSLIRVTSSSESQKHISVSISVTITYIWTKFGTELKYRTNNMPAWSNSDNLKNVNNSGPDKDICIKFYRIMHWTLAYTTASRRVRQYKLFSQSER